MRKHNEGYSLVLVLVVMVVLSLIAVALMSFSLNNLKAQKAYTDRMQAQYAAQGEVEVLLAKLDNAFAIKKTLVGKTVDEAKLEVEETFRAAVGPHIAIDEIRWIEVSGDYDCIVRFTATESTEQAVVKGSVSIHGILVLEDDSIHIESTDISYGQYEILNLQSAPEGDSGEVSG